MTDSEVIKALECFAIDKDFDETQCIGCLFEKQGLCCENCSDGIAKASLNLIKTLKLEINVLSDEVDARSDEILNLTADKKMMGDTIDRQKSKIDKIIKDLKYYLENEENGVVFIPKFIIEKRIKELQDHPTEKGGVQE